LNHASRLGLGASQSSEYPVGMDELTKPIWWLSVVVAGVLVNLASAYLKPRIDAVLLQSSSWWRSRSQARIAAQERLINEHRNLDRQVATFVKSLIAGIYGLFFCQCAILFHLMLIDNQIHKGHAKVEATGTDLVSIVFVPAGMFFALLAFSEFHNGLQIIRKAAESNNRNADGAPPKD
jgi:hypothetical protein